MEKDLKQTEYKVLARKYRPQTFKDLLGQETLVRTLTNAISQNRIAHAYLFTGVRGIGKTTTARLVAMSLNCENRLKDNCEPCGNCNACTSVREDRNLDVIEMDAASRTGVDDIREIIDNVKYKPVNTKYKIFIIDEVHMLSKNAFNALLKTLEEPPEHVKFIFATTEVKKIPITIISRCQRFDLLRINTVNLTSHLLKISEKENIDIDQNAIALIVRSADGSVRDSLSLLDQAISNSKDKITSQLVINMLGLADRVNIFELLDAIFKGNAVNALEIFTNIYQSGADIMMIFDEMLNVTHFITQMKISPDLKNDINIPEFERLKGSEIASKISMASLGTVWQVLFRGYEELQSGFHLFQHGEMIIIRLIYLYDGPSPEEIIKKFDKKNNKSSNLNINAIDNNIVKNEKASINQKNKKDIETNLINVDEKNITKTFNIVKINSYRHFVDLFYKNREAMLHTYLYNNAKLISFKEGEVVLNTLSIADSHFMRTIAKLVSKWTGRIWQVVPSSSNIGQTLHEEDLIEQQKEIEIMKNDKEIKKILEKFPGVVIHSISNISQTIEENENFNLDKKTKEK